MNFKKSRWVKASNMNFTPFVIIKIPLWSMAWSLSSCKLWHAKRANDIFLLRCFRNRSLRTSVTYIVFTNSKYFPAKHVGEPSCHRAHKIVKRSRSYMCVYCVCKVVNRKRIMVFRESPAIFPQRRACMELSICVRSRYSLTCLSLFLLWGEWGNVSF